MKHMAPRDHKTCVTLPMQTRIPRNRDTTPIDEELVPKRIKHKALVSKTTCLESKQSPESTGSHILLEGKLSMKNPPPCAFTAAMIAPHTVNG